MLSLSFVLTALLPTIWVVDAANGPGTNFTDLPAAVAVAQTGDTIIVRPGTYTAFECAGKALTIRGAGAATTIVANSNGFQHEVTAITSVPAGATFFVDGMAFAPNPALASAAAATPALRLGGSGGSYALADVAVTGYTQSILGGAGLQVTGGVVHAARCAFGGGLGTGGGGISSGGQGGAGALVQTGAVLVADSCTFTGGWGGFFVSSLTANAGGSGLLVDGGTATVASCEFLGGPAVPQPNGAFGGDGIRARSGGTVRAAGSAAQALQGAVQANAASSGFAAVALTGASILIHNDLVLGSTNPAGPVSGNVTTGLPRMPTTTAAGTPDASGELLATHPVTVTIDGVLPFALCTFALSFAPDYTTAFAPLTLGEVLVPLSDATFFDIPLDAAGQFVFTFNPALDVPGIVGVPTYAQVGVFDGVAGQYRMSNGCIRFYRP